MVVLACSAVRVRLGLIAIWVIAMGAFLAASIHTPSAHAQQPQSVVSGGEPSRALVDVEPRPGLAIVKTGPVGLAQMGSRLAYTIVVTNTGDVPLTNVVVTDDLLGLTEVVGTLEPGDSAIVSGTLEVTDALVPIELPREAESFVVTNTATASSDQIGPVSDRWDVEVEYTFHAWRAALGLVKVGPPVASVGDTIEYLLRVKNIGDVPLSDVQVSDPQIGLEEAAGTLLPGEQRLYSGYYTVTEADLPGPLGNVATAFNPTAGTVTAEWSVPIAYEFQEPTQPTPTPWPTSAPPQGACARSDVAVVVDNGWDGILVRAWVGGTEQPARRTARNAVGEVQATWTLYPPEGTRWTVSVAGELPPDLDASRWEIIPVGATSVSVGRCEEHVLHLRMVDHGAQAGRPTAVPVALELPRTGSASLDVAARLAGWLGIGGLTGLLARSGGRRRRH